MRAGWSTSLRFTGLVRGSSPSPEPRLVAARDGHRSLAALARGGSTARVLNLSVLAAELEDDTEYRNSPFFQTAVLNTSIVLKHGLRPYELQLFDSPPAIATKVIVPFDRRDLAMGGWTVFVNQRGWEVQLSALVTGATTLERDVQVLKALDELPSLDPFLVREHLARRGFKVASCYFVLSVADLERMRTLVSSEIEQLIRRAFSGGATSDHTAKLVELLLTDEADERLEPLRQTLRLEGEAYKEGIFAWKGFLYYKWVLAELQDPLNTVRRALRELKPARAAGAVLGTEIVRAKTRLANRIDESERSAQRALQVYDDAYGRLIGHDDAGAFRDFLIESPRMFLSLGEAVGGVSHVTSYWNYRFAKGAPVTASAIELLDTLHEFEAALPAELSSPAAKPGPMA